MDNLVTYLVIQIAFTIWIYTKNKMGMVHIAEILREVAKDWNLDDKVAAVVHDNASNMVLACDLLED